MMDKFFVDRGDAILVIVDIQERLAAVMSERQRVVANTLHLIEGARLMEVPIIVTEQYPKGLGPTVPEIREELKPYEPIEKLAFGCCGEPSFLKKIFALEKKRIVLAGMETHVCVLQTCLGLIRGGYVVHVVNDAVCSRTKGSHKTGIELMRDAGAVVTCTEIVLFQLLERAGTEEFKAISKRIK